MLLRKLSEWWKKKTTILELKKPILVLDIYGEEHNYITSIYMDSFNIHRNVYNIWNKIGIVPKTGAEPSYSVGEINSGIYRKNDYVIIDHIVCEPYDMDDCELYQREGPQLVIYFLKHHFRFIPNTNGEKHN